MNKEKEVCEKCEDGIIWKHADKTSGQWCVCDCPLGATANIPPYPDYEPEDLIRPSTPKE